MPAAVDARWKTLELVMPDPARPDAPIEVTLLRPPAWVPAVDASPGACVPIELDELVRRGEARVVSIRVPPPAVEPGPGRVVLATIARTSDQVLSQTLRGSDRPLEVTANHRLYSAERNGWTEATDLRPGERLMTAEGEAVLDSARRLPSSHRVYNLEVEQEHEYHVSGIAVAVRAHNACTSTLAPEGWEEAPLREAGRPKREFSKRWAWRRIRRRCQRKAVRILMH
jgi:hypothetical protein